MTENEKELLAEVQRLSKRLAAYETAINAFPEMAHELADTIEGINNDN